jgi:hypothetical protein
MLHFTENDLILYISGEMDSNQAKALSTELLINPILMEQYQTLSHLWQKTKSLAIEMPQGLEDRLFRRLVQEEMVV